MKVAFVLPWFSKDIVGGAELECRYTAANLQQKGVTVDILTTCVKNFFSPWDYNYFSEGTSHEAGLSIKRFPAKKRNVSLFNKLNKKILLTSACYTNSDFLSPYLLPSPLSIEEEEAYIEEMINSPSLYKYIYDNKNEYDYFIFIPYLFSTSYFGSLICPEKSVLIPCLHSLELNAYLTIYRRMFLNVSKIIFHTSSEKNFALQLYKSLATKNLIVLGEGVNCFSYTKTGFAKKYEVKHPFILYVGRKSEGKNTPVLLNYFCKYRENNPKSDICLILIGDGEVNIPVKHNKYVMDMGILSDEDKYNAYSDALFLCQPSLRESFSLVIMESWLTERPVLVSGHCDVTKDHCIMSNGGLYFTDYAEFDKCVNLFVHKPEIASKLGKNGKEYVEKNYTWEVIMKKYISFLQAVE